MYTEGGRGSVGLHFAEYFEGALFDELVSVAVRLEAAFESAPPSALCLGHGRFDGAKMADIGQRVEAVPDDAEMPTLPDLAQQQPDHAVLCKLCDHRGRRRRHQIADGPGGVLLRFEVAVAQPPRQRLDAARQLDGGVAVGR